MRVRRGPRGGSAWIPAGIGAAALFACGGPPPAEPPAAAPNVLLLSIDTLRADHLGFYGYERPTSPELDAFAETAVVFDSAQSSASWTLPGLASIFTSAYTSTHGCWDFGTRLDDSFTTLTELLLAAGYDTACIVSHIYCTPSYGLTQGFVHVDDSLTLTDVDPDLAVTSREISDRGIAFLQHKAAAPDGEPWFLWLHYFDPHADYVRQEGFTEAFVDSGDAPEGEAAPEPTEVDLYDGEIAYTDHHVGRVLDALAQAAHADDTVVVVVSDHGEEFFDHGGHDHGHSLYAELIRVPLAIRAPGIAPRRVSRPVRTLDLFPTLLELAGLPVTSLAGHSLVDAMRGGLAPDAAVLSEIRLDPRNEFEAVIEDGYKLIRRVDPHRRELYDLNADPGERVNLKGELPEKLDELERRLTELVEEAERQAERFQQGVRHDLTAQQVDTLQKLGYTGGDDEDGEAPAADEEPNE